MKQRIASLEQRLTEKEEEFCKLQPNMKERREELKHHASEAVVKEEIGGEGANT